MGRLGSISPEFAGKQGHVSGFLRGHTEGSVLPHGQIDAACLHVAWEICLCFSTGMSTVCCCWIQTLMLLSSETEWAFPAFWRGGRGCSATGWHDEPHKHFNECCLGQWWHLKSHFLNLELSEHFPWKGAFWRKLHIRYRLTLSHTQVPKERSKYSDSQPRALQMRLSWVSLFCLPLFCWSFAISPNGSPGQ